ncbi:MAG: hypothetical protein KKH28_06690, partial [Elusimicrobia bacterium]|nr:hypothetical protein [Elusimicrobiota bacterium]
LVKSLFCKKISFVVAGFSLRSRRQMVSRLSQAKACDYHLGLFTNESTFLVAGVLNACAGAVSGAMLRRPF